MALVICLFIPICVRTGSDCLSTSNMRNYEVDPLVSIKTEGVVNTFCPSRIDNSKIFIGCQNSLIESGT